MSVAAGAATMLPAGRLLSAPGDSSAGSDLRAVKLSGAETTIERAAVQDLRASLSGTLLVPGDEGYETSRRVWNGMIDKHPALIARCTNTADVVRAVTFARERELLLAVRGGGHSFPGYSTCDGGLVIDLSPMRIVEVHSDTRTVRAAGGAWGAHVDAAAQRYALATTVGQISNTGVAGLTLGGGFGWLSRRFGLACDNLVSVELVTADGKVRRVSEHDEPDLFWAIRGGGGNFGVATSFEYRLHPLNPTVIAGHVDFPTAQIKDAIEFYVGLITHAPRELSVDLSLHGNDDGTPASTSTSFTQEMPRAARRCLSLCSALASRSRTRSDRRATSPYKRGLIRPPWTRGTITSRVASCGITPRASLRCSLSSGQMSKLAYIAKMPMARLQT